MAGFSAEPIPHQEKRDGGSHFTFTNIISLMMMMVEQRSLRAMAVNEKWLVRVSGPCAPSVPSHFRRESFALGSQLHTCSPRDESSEGRLPHIFCLKVD